MSNNEPDQAVAADAALTAAAEALASAPADKSRRSAKSAAIVAKTNSSSKVYVGCRHPHGIILTVGDTSVELKGMNSAVIAGTYGLTQVDEEFWAAWLKSHSDWPMVVNGMIFAQAKVADLQAEAEEVADEKTGFEALSQNSGGVEPSKT